VLYLTPKQCQQQPQLAGCVAVPEVEAGRWLQRGRDRSAVDRDRPGAGELGGWRERWRQRHTPARGAPDRCARHALPSGEVRGAGVAPVGGARLARVRALEEHVICDVAVGIARPHEAVPAQQTSTCPQLRPKHVLAACATDARQGEVRRATRHKAGWGLGGRGARLRTDRSCGSGCG
jgi:hypothetical protein